MSFQKKCLSFQKLLSFKQNSDDANELRKLVDPEEENIQDDRIVKPLGRKAKRALKRAHCFLDKEVDYFITRLANNFFRRFNIPTHFLHSDLDIWNGNLDFHKGPAIVKSFRVVNDTAEKCAVTKDEEQKQYLSQVVVECKKILPDTLKSTPSKSLCTTYLIPVTESDKSTYQFDLHTYYY